MIKDKRTSGILLHISSLPSPFGIGTLGKEAYEFVDFLSSVNMKLWQVLPLNVISFGNSPYQSPSAIGLNPYFIDLRILKDEGLLTQEELDESKMNVQLADVDYELLYKYRLNILKIAFKRFDKNSDEFISFVNSGTYHDCCYYLALKEKNGNRSWKNFSENYKKYDPDAEQIFLNDNKELYLFYQFTQFEFLKQYFKLKNYANSKGIKIIGDMPIYLAYDSVEVYKYPQLFQLDSNLDPIVVSGCPPDYFSKTGQLWGNPIYDWDKMKEDNYSWFSSRLNYNLKLFDYVRIDHFIGFASYYAIPFKDKDASNGKRVVGPGFDLFKDKLDLNIIAEDLGVKNELIDDLLVKTMFPGMKELCFAFDGKKDNTHLPSHSVINSLCYTGTHDNTPIYQYICDLEKTQYEIFKSSLIEECKKFNVECLSSSKRDLALMVDELAFASPSVFAILPLQDLLASGKETRMNEPSTTVNNWKYRCKKDDFSSSLKNFIKRCVKKYNR